MPNSNIPQKLVRFEIQAYERPKGVENLRKAYVPFSGTPRTHPHNPKKIVLIADPYSTSSMFYEFKTDDVAFVEELPNIVNMEGEVVTMMRLWIKKKSIAVRCTPFVVEETGRT